MPSWCLFSLWTGFALMCDGILVCCPDFRNDVGQKLRPFIGAHPVAVIAQLNTSIVAAAPADFRDLRPVALRYQRAGRCQRAAVVGQPSKRSPLRNAHHAAAPAHNASSSRTASAIILRSTSSTSRNRRK